jgi:hypothetical protein
MVITHHVPDFQIFHDDLAVSANNLSGFLVVEVHSLVSDFYEMLFHG